MKALRGPIKIQTQDLGGEKWFTFPQGFCQKWICVGGD
jgi:hypothetical protein